MSDIPSWITWGSVAGFIGLLTGLITFFWKLNDKIANWRKRPQLEIIQHDPSFPETLIERLQGALNQVERSAKLIDSVKRFQRVDFEPIQLQRIDVYKPLKTAIY